MYANVRCDIYFCHSDVKWFTAGTVLVQNFYHLTRKIAKREHIKRMCFILWQSKTSRFAHAIL